MIDMMYKSFIQSGIILSLVLLVFFEGTIKAQPSLKAPITDNSIVDWDRYLDSSDSHQSYRFLLNIMSFAERNNQSALSFYFVSKYLNNYPTYKNKLERLRLIYEEYMLSQMALPTSHFVYDSYIKVNAPKDKAYTALKMRIANSNNKMRWEEAEEVCQILKSYFKEDSVKVNSLISLISKKWDNSIVRNLGKTINTTDDEWDPNPTPDGKYIYYSGKNRPGGFGDVDVWYSEKKDGHWTTPQNMGRMINSGTSETVDNVSTDGNLLLLSGNIEGTFGEFDIYTIEREDSSWSNMKHLPMPINSEYVEEGACMSSDGQVMIFTSDRPGGVGPTIAYGKRRYNGSVMGNMDLYCIKKNGDEWDKEVINLGEIINTPYAERSPYLHPDGKTLYFSSNGHYGLGGLDVFKSTRLDSTWTNWSKPINLGKEINTIQNDWGYKISVDGDSAFFAAQNRTIGYGGYDLFTIKLPNEAKPEKVITIFGQVVDSQGKPLEAEIKWEDLTTGEIVGKLKSHPTNGNYFIVLPLGKFYGYFADKKGFYPSSKNIDLRDIKNAGSYGVNIVMYSEEEILNSETQIVINNIFFDSGKWELKNESSPEIERLVSFLIKNPQIKIELSGHTDNIGEHEDNILLSQKRVESIKQYLVKRGVEFTRINTFGYGESRPINDNSTKEKRALNRRVEFKVLK